MNRKIWFVSNWYFLGILSVVGLAAWFYQIVRGMEVTALNQQVVWGMYIAGFFTAAGAGAGILALVGMSEFTEFIPRPMRPKALLMSLACFCAAGLLITMDIGNIPQVWRLATAFKTNAAMTWDFWALLLTAGVTLFYLLQTQNGTRTNGSLKWMGGLGVLSAVALIAIEGLMLAITDARPFWVGGSTVFEFFLSAFVMGLTLSFFVLDEKNSRRAKTWLVMGLIICFVLSTLEMSTGLLLSSSEEAHISRMLLTGQASPIFWTYLVLGLLLPIWLILRGSGNFVTVTMFVVLGILAEKLCVLIAGQAQPMLHMPEGIYFPNWIEILATLGATAFALLTFKILSLVFPDPANKLRVEAITK